MRRLFAVVNNRGAAWQSGRPLEEQRDWRPHADFMNALVKEGLVVLGGPLEGTDEVLLIIRAHTPEEIVKRLAADPWVSLDLLRVSRIAPWTLRLGALPSASA